jgi:beta-phosphoglucomutase family hydrolase
MKGVIYDMDDLMINSSPVHVASWAALKKYGHSLDEVPKDIRSNFVGLRIVDTVKILIEHFKLKVSVEDFYRERQELFHRLVREKLEAMPGLRQSLEFFKRNDYKIALASSGTRDYIDFVLDKFKIREYYDAIVSGEDVNKGKPDPEPYLLACKKLGLSPRECVVLEDAANGVKAAKAAGCKCIGIDSPYTPLQDLSMADLELESLLEINKKSIAKLNPNPQNTPVFQ